MKRMTHARMERILREARVPVVRAGRYVFHADPYYGAHRWPTYNIEQDTVYLVDDDALDCLHEHGHVFNVKVLRPEHQQLLREWWHRPNRIWWWGEKGRSPLFPGPDALCEVFAELYAHAARSRHPRYYRFKKLLKIAAKEAGYGN